MNNVTTVPALANTVNGRRQVSIPSTFAFNDAHNVRVVDIGGAPWFVAADVCRMLALSNTTMSLRLLDVSEKTLYRIEGRSGPAVNIISESGLYKLIMRSDKPEARPFQDWVAKVVLPAIRKDGAYVMGEEKVAIGELSEDELVLKAVAILQRKVERSPATPVRRLTTNR